MTIDFHAVSCRLITDPADDLKQVDTAFRRYLNGIDLVKEKIEIKRDSFIDSLEQKRYMYMMQIKLPRLVRTFVKQLFASLTAEQRNLLIMQLPSRVDEECQFFLRFEKDLFLTTGEVKLTDGGNCFHITLTVASFPHKKEVACAVVEKYLK